MPALSNQQQTLLHQATKNIDLTNRELIRDLLTHMSDVSSWFRDALITALEYGVTFVCEATDTAASYEFKTKRIIFNSNLLNIPTSTNLLADALHYILRHEMTHAIDFKGLYSTNSNIKMTSFALLVTHSDLANQLMNQLACVKSLHKANVDVLDQISTLLIPLNSTTHLLEFAHTQSGLHLINESISFFGSYVSSLNKIGSLPTYILKIFQFANSHYYLTEQTMNPLVASNLLNATSSIRMKHGYTSFFLTPHFNNEELALWKSLSTKQQQALNILYQTWNAILKNIPKDSTCTPKLEQCLTLEKQDCLNEFLKCQSGGLQLVSYNEIHASLNEYFEGSLLSKTRFNSLCMTPTSQQTYTKTMLGNALHCGLYSFADELSDAYFENKKIKYGAAWSLLVSAILVACLGYIEYLLSDEKEASIKLQIGIPMMIMLLTRLLKTVVSPKITLLASAISIPFLIMSEPSAATNIPTGFASASLACLAAKSMAVGLGWKESETATREIEIDEDQSEDNTIRKKNT